MSAPDPIIRILLAGLGPDAQVRLAVSALDEPERLRSVWASSGALVQRDGPRLLATTTVQALARAAGRAFGADMAQRMANQLRDRIAAWAGPPPALPLSTCGLATDVRPLVMGIVNVTPDSFSDGGVLYPDGHPVAAVAHGRALLTEGADVLDVGGESTRPGSEPVEIDEELRRVVPVVAALAAEGAVVSVDTVKRAVAEAALDAGALIVNDVSGGRDQGLLRAVGERGAGYVLMHTRGTPTDMQSHADYDDVVAEVYEFLAAGVDRCAVAGIRRERIVLDPGLGFAKTAAHNLALLRSLRQLRGLGRPLLVGASRKSFLGALLGGAGTNDRLEGSLACAAIAVREGAALLRVHDVAATVRVANVARGVTTGALDWPPGRA
ncbi:MAG: dihydropteroate synthase [Egibacteraceae bacterium]